ncbi:uncharacterized protein FIBRA_03957 [Fibroporia radiculosa]|uniref:AMP-dependent synthetase/ligase domain-containing protein n=1 Tax=Fibroporia radiculosa TaxID=599839 RepID=J4I9W8_9APHY|nr:uncharacterized protein FIBRA_03957 [Fibroporia radiculosa]CCM01886.1 predicted protein [Fibroporia radiculosa]
MVIKSPFRPVPVLPNINVHDFIFNNPKWDPNASFPIFVDGLTGQEVSRKDFLERVRDGATALSAPTIDGGVGIGQYEQEIVGILGHNAVDYITLLHSLLVIATPFALLSAFATSYELAQALRTSKVTRLFVQPSFLPTALQAAREVGLPEDRIIVFAERFGGRQSFHDLIDNVRARRIPRVPVKPVSKDTLAYLVFSSGTSGLPKAVMISHGNVCFSLAQNAVALQEINQPAPAGPVKVLAFLPMYHSYGLHMFGIRGFWSPLTFILIPKWDLDVLCKVVPQYHIHVLIMVPSTIHQLVHDKRFRADIFASVVSIASGAAQLPPALPQRLKDVLGGNLEISEGFGMSEVTIGAMRGTSPEMFGGKIPPIVGALGVLLPGMEGRIVREDGSDAEFHEPGELWLRGENVALGYWGNEEATRKTFGPDGWLKTGDQLKIDELGRFYFVDRAKDTLKISGMQVSPSEIENVLIAHPNKLITDICVGGVPGSRAADEKIPRAWIVLSEEGRKRGLAQVIRELDAWSRKNLSKYKWLRGGIEAINEIPKSPTGKVLRRVLQDRYEEQTRQAARAKL